MSGNYTARVEGGLPFVVGTFDSLRFKRERTVVDYPYFYLLPIGAAVSVFGLVMVILGSRRTPRKRFLKKRAKLAR